jgi:hypothetical protein
MKEDDMTVLIKKKFRDHTLFFLSVNITHWGKEK